MEISSDFNGCPNICDLITVHIDPDLERHHERTDVLDLIQLDAHRLGRRIVDPPTLERRIASLPKPLIEEHLMILT